MTAKLRSASGAVLMLLIVPVIVGLLACLPVPVGNPERSRVDPQVTGVWAIMEDDEVSAYYAFEPFDKRAWLLTFISDNKAGLYKAWVTRLAGHWFMTWEPKAVFGEEDFEPEVWFVFRLERPDENTLQLQMVDGDAEVFKGVKETRRAYERVLKKNVDDDDIYSSDALRLIRITPEQHELFEDLAGEVIWTD